METYGGVDVEIHVFLTSALARGEWLASRPGHSNRHGGSQSWCGQHAEEGIKLVLTGTEIPNPSAVPARSQTLFRYQGDG
jgi:hypothetical protein